MTSTGDGNWTYTAPFPSGIYQYAFLVDCFDPTNCTLDNRKYVIDADNQPFVNIPNDQIASRFQVPFDETFQSYADFDLNFDYTLPVPEERRGTVASVNYTSPGSIRPAPDVHDFVIYLPKEYGTVAGKKYPLLYLHHGGGGDAQDWENQGYASNILDQLILGDHIEPTVVVMPSFYNIESEYAFVPGTSLLGSFPPSNVVRENYMSYLFPYVEVNYDVSTDPAQRAFAGLSLGGLLTFEMYINATDYFDYYGMFSGVLLSSEPATDYINSSIVAAHPSYATKGIYSSAGLYDFAFENVREVQVAFDGAGVPYRGRIVPFGFHYWNTWTDCLWNFGKQVLWKPLPFAPFATASP
jgi:enterochelin esterase-like enzyme